MSAIATKNKSLEFQATTKANVNADTPTRPTEENTANSSNWMVANFNSAGFDESRESIETTIFADDKRNRVFGLADSSGSGDGVYADDDSAFTALQNGMRQETYFWFRYMPSGRTVGSKAEVFAGIVTAISRSGEVAGVETFNVTIEGVKVPVETVTLI